jgi:hypothetical protein
MKVFEYEVFIPKSSQYESKYRLRELEVGLENDNYMVLIDPSFTTINKASRSGSCLNKTLDKHTISTWETGCGSIDGIHYTEYSSHKVRPETIKRRIESYINEKYGYLMKPDLRFITLQGE